MSETNTNTPEEALAAAQRNSRLPIFRLPPEMLVKILRKV
jgi:hypothetical protein